jgi:ATP-dependent DNA helicase RecG
MASVLRDAGLAEAKGTGIRAMRKAMREANLTVPVFDSDRPGDHFTVTLFVHHLLGEEDWAWLAQFRECNLDDGEARALMLLREAGRLDNATYRAANDVDTLSASQHLRRLRDLGLLQQEGSGAKTFYTAGVRLLRGKASAPEDELPRDLHESSSEVRGSPHESEESFKLSLHETATSLGIAPLPEAVVASIARLGPWAKTDDLRATVRLLCAWMPLPAGHLAALLDRQRTYLVQRILAPMLRDGEICLMYPDRPSHPRQAYRTPSNPGDSS